MLSIGFLGTEKIAFILTASYASFAVLKIAFRLPTFKFEICATFVVILSPSRNSFKIII
jgi:hypothetical protein